MQCDFNMTFSKGSGDTELTENVQWDLQREYSEQKENSIKVHFLYLVMQNLVYWKR